MVVDGRVAITRWSSKSWSGLGPTRSNFGHCLARAEAPQDALQAACTKLLRVVAGREQQATAAPGCASRRAQQRRKAIGIEAGGTTRRRSSTSVRTPLKSRSSRLSGPNGQRFRGPSARGPVSLMPSRASSSRIEERSCAGTIERRQPAFTAVSRALVPGTRRVAGWRGDREQGRRGAGSAPARRCSSAECAGAAGGARR